MVGGTPQKIVIYQNFDLNLLSSLDALLAEKNVTTSGKKDARHQQSTMSGILRRLRDQFDDELLVRNGRRYDLSPFAQSLAITVRQTILQIDSTISAKPLFDPKKDHRRFRIMASDYSTMVYLSAVFRRVEKQAPYLSYDIVPINSPIDNVRSGTVDLCVTGNPYTQADASSDQFLRSDTLFSGDLIAASSTTIIRCAAPSRWISCSSFPTWSRSSPA